MKASSDSYRTQKEPIALAQAGDVPIAESEERADREAEMKAIRRLNNPSDESIPLEQALSELGIR